MGFLGTKCFFSLLFAWFFFFFLVTGYAVIMPFLCLFKHWCTTDKKVEADTIIAYVILTVFKVMEKLISQTLVFKEKPIQNMIFGHQIPKGYE